MLMDTSAYEVLLANLEIIAEQCITYSSGQTIRKWLGINGINDIQYFYYQRKVSLQRGDEMYALKYVYHL